MKIHGLQKMTLLDFPGRVACTVFLGQCDFRCPYCHNFELVTGEAPPVMSEEELLAFLRKRRGLLDGVAITGGEPCLHPGLYDMLGNGGHYVLDTISSANTRDSHARGFLQELKCGYKESETDPLRLYVPKDRETTACHLMRGVGEGLRIYRREAELGRVNRYAGPRMWTFRVVIGPDLVSEWMAKNGKK